MAPEKPKGRPGEKTASDTITTTSIAGNTSSPLEDAPVGGYVYAAGEDGKAAGRGA